MRHRKKGKILKRKRDPRRALVRSLVRSFILTGKVETTHAKAKVLRQNAERHVTRAKKGTLHARRQAARALDARSLKHLFDVIGPRYKDRKGGYTRIMKKGPRKGDRTEMAIVEFV